MKKSSKVVSLVLAVLMAMSCFTGLSLFSASATETTTKFYFKLPVDLWNVKDADGNSLEGDSTTSVYCHIWAIDNDSDFAGASWQAKSEKCTYDKDLGLYSYDIAAKLKQTLKDNADYGIIFSVKSSKITIDEQTFNTTMGVSCYGDTAYLSGKKYENPEDSSKLAWGAFWTNDANKNVYGPQKTITSGGDLTGEYWAPHQSAPDAIAQFINGKAPNIQSRIDTEGVYCCVNLCEELNTTPEAVYNSYKTLYATELAADPVTIPTLDVVATFLQYTPAVTTEAPTTEEPTEAPTTEEPTTVEPTTEEPTVAPTTVEPTTEEPTEAPTTEEPTTVEPTTEEPTVAPTTVEPTTEAPTTVEPTTEAPTSEPAKLYTVAGDAALTGVAWDPAQNSMTAGSYTYNDTVYDYAITFADIAAGSYSFKVTDGTWDNAWGKDGGNYGITLSDTCPVTIYFNSETTEIAVEAEYLTTFTLETITAVGNGDGTWLNGANWDTADTSNDLKEIEPGVWQITYENIDAFDNYQVKFACNHAWAYNWTSDGVLDGQTNPANVVAEDGSTVVLTIDVSGFDFATKNGSVFTKFEVLPPETKPCYGDLNGDGVITIDDVTALQKGIVNASLTEIQTIAGDVNGDGKTNITDVTFIQKYIAKKGFNTANVGMEITVD